MQPSGETKICCYLAAKVKRVDRTVSKSKIKGTISAPSSKSVLQRYIVAALLADGESELRHVIHCADSIACLEAVKLLGAKVSGGLGGGVIRIAGCRGKILPVADVINCNESGFALRTLAAVAGLSEHEITLTGNGSLLKRPVDFIENVLPLLGIEANSNEGLLPLNIKGPMRFRDLSIDGSISSQFLSGLLMVFPFAGEEHTIEVNNLQSRQYVDLTIKVLKDFGIGVQHNNYQKFFIEGNQRYHSCSADIEGDWSSASCMLVAGATSGEITIQSLAMDSLQPDKAIAEVIRQAGAEVSVNDGNITVKKGKVKSFSFDATHCPDLFPALVALAVQCEGVSEITGIHRLVHKESNRALALQKEFSKLNDKLITIEGNKMVVNGMKELKNATVDSHNDHRIAMALAVTGLNIPGGITIQRSEAVEKSYPEFFLVLSKLAANFTN